MNPFASRTQTKLSYASPEYQQSISRLLRETPASEQPLARMERCGPGALSSAELLQLVLDSKADPLLPLRLLKPWKTLNQLAHASPAELLHVDGMTRLRLAHLRAALEMGRRMWTEPLQDRPVVRAPADAVALLVPEMSGLQQEQMRVILLDTRNRVLGIPLVYQGSLHTTMVRISEIFRDAVHHNCAGIILAHSHPSMDPTPSPEDVSLTTEAVRAGKLLDILLMDHLIIGSAHYWLSMKEQRLGIRIGLRIKHEGHLLRVSLLFVLSVSGSFFISHSPCFRQIRTQTNDV